MDIQTSNISKMNINKAMLNCQQFLPSIVVVKRIADILTLIQFRIVCRMQSLPHCTVRRCAICLCLVYAVYMCLYVFWLGLAIDYGFKKPYIMSLHLIRTVEREMDFIFVSNTIGRQCLCQMGTVFLLLFHYGFCLLHDPFACLYVWVSECVYLCVSVCGGGC